MNISRLPLTAPILCIDDFLTEEEAQRVLQECIDLKKIYLPARVFDTPYTTKVDLSYRKNDVVYLGDIFKSCPERSDILSIFKAKIWTDECRKIWHKGYYIFDVINYSTWQEAVISRYDGSGFYHRHQDTRWDHITFRLVTFVYYVNRIPEGFEGGALAIWHEDKSVRVQPKHNRAVVFPSFLSHEVETVRMVSDRWEDGRFSINYWVGFR
jgi:2OG-Fe(II) oxygenase superfamily